MIQNKLFIVILVLLIIFAGLIIQVILLDLKVRKLEKKLKDRELTDTKKE